MRKLFLIEKKTEYAHAARRLYRQLTERLHMHAITGVRILRCLIFDGWRESYAALGVSSCICDAHTEVMIDEDEVRSAALLPDTACICVIPLFRRPAEQLTQKAMRMMVSFSDDSAFRDREADDPIAGQRLYVRQADVFLVSGPDMEEDGQRIRLKQLLINPASSAELPLFTTGTLPPLITEPNTGYLPVRGFREMNDEALTHFAAEERFRMSQEDLRFIRSYFRVEEKRDPNRFELRMIDTYWSDHCRHITFLTALQDLRIADREIAQTFDLYLETRESLYGTRPKNITLMDIATVAAKYLIREGKLTRYVETGEKNAFTVHVMVQTDAGEQPWLLHYKNETHNHSTEQDPYSGAFTSFGATIADPLSARAEVIAAMRLSGDGFYEDADADIEKQNPVKLRMETETADGFSAFGVQAGIPTGYVHKWLHEGFAAKHMEVCFAASAAPETEGKAVSAVAAGDVVVLVGAKTGRDGLGGGLNASAVRTGNGPSIYCKTEEADAMTDSDHKVSENKNKRRTYTSQIGDPQASRALVRMMRRADVRRLVKRASDVGSGGIAVAATELCGGVRIDLDRVPTSVSDRIAIGRVMTPYEIAFSETQARMLLVVSSSDVPALSEIAGSEDLDVSVIGTVTSERRCRLLWWDRTLLSLSRDFLDATGAERRVSAYIPPADTDRILCGISDHLSGEGMSELYLRLMMHPDVAAQNALCQRFDATAGGHTVILPYGGKKKLTPADYMAFRFPTETMGMGKTHTCAVFSCGYLPRCAQQSPYHGAYLAVLQAICRLAAAGVPLRDMTLSLQEYFPTVGEDPMRFGIPLAAMLGAFRAQMDYEVAAIGGKDSMNGTDAAGSRDVPPTVIAFGAAGAQQEQLLTAEFKKAGSRVYLLAPEYGDHHLPDTADEKNLLAYLHLLQENGKILSCMAVGAGGVAAGIAMMCFGNGIGFNYEPGICSRKLFEDRPGAFLVETDEKLRGLLIGYTKDSANIFIGADTLPLSLLAGVWCKPQEKTYADLPDYAENGIVASFPKKEHTVRFPKVILPKMRVLLPVLPYMTGEDVLAARFYEAGMEPVKLIIGCRSDKELKASLAALVNALRTSDIGVLAFAGGSYPGYGSVSAAISDPAAHFAKAIFHAPEIKEAFDDFCADESHLVLGIGEGFRMLLASGAFDTDAALSPNEQISLAENPCGHLVSDMVRVRVMSVSSPWMRFCESGEIYTLPVASKAGRCVIPDELILEMGSRGWIASQYVDADGNPTMDSRWNPFASDFAVEGIFARGGRIFGRMAHCDRVGADLCINVPGNKEQNLFRAAADYYHLN